MGPVAVCEGALEPRMAPARVHADWKPEALGLSPDRVEILVAQKRFPDSSIDRQTHRAEILSAACLLDRFRHRAHGQNSRPFDPVRMLVARRGHPAIVAFH